MKSFLLISFLAIASLLTLSSCEKSLSLNDTNQDYFPLAVGNYWELSFRGTFTVDKVVNIEGKEYFRVTYESYLSPYTNTRFRDTIYYRKTADGKVYERNNATNEYLKFDLKAAQGQTWNYVTENVRFYIYPWNANLRSVNDTIHLGNEIIENCYKYWFDIPQVADEEHFIVLAPGLGIVRELYLGGWPDRIALKKVRINGVVREF